MVVALAMTGCGGRTTATPGSPARTTSAADTVRTDVAGRTLVIPAPDGMLDYLTATGVRAPRSGHGDLVVGMFLKRGQLEAAMHGAGRHDLSVMALVPPGNWPTDENNAARFETARTSWLSTGAKIKDPVALRIAKALDRAPAAAEPEISAPFPPGDTVAVLVESPDAQSVQLLAVAHNLPARAAAYDLYSSSLLLVRGRIIKFMWVRRGAFSVRDLAEVRDEMRRWMAAVQSANP